MIIPARPIWLGGDLLMCMEGLAQPPKLGAVALFFPRWGSLMDLSLQAIPR